MLVYPIARSKLVRPTAWDWLY